MTSGKIHTACPFTGKIEIFTVIVIVIGIALRFCSLSFFEFKDDQFSAIMDAASTVRKHFLVSHGMMSGVGIPNPPGFCWLCGLFSFFADSPAQFAMIFVLISAATIFVWLFLAQKSVPKDKLLYVACLMSSSTALVIYSSNIWAQCLMPIIAISVLCLLASFISGAKDINWVYAFWLNGLAASLHFSGFFLFPVTMLALLIRKTNLKMFMTAVLPVTLVFMPFFIYITKFLSSAGMNFENGGIHALRNISFLFDFHSCGFMKYYMGVDLKRVLTSQIGSVPTQTSIFFINIVFGAFLLCGTLFLISRIIRLKGKIMEFTKEKDILIALSGVHLIAVTTAYLILNIKTFPHYFLIVVPAGYVIIADFAVSEPFAKIKKIMLSSAIVFQLFITSALMLFIYSAGGHPKEYGVHYGLLKTWSKEYHGLAKGVEGISAVSIAPSDDAIIKSSYSAITYGVNPGQDGTVKPDKIYILHIAWDYERMCYLHKWTERY